MTPQVFVITCFDKETDNFEELSGAFVKRKLAEEVFDALSPLQLTGYS